MSRPRLLAVLDRGADRRLTLVTGSAGSGKTTLLSNWLATQPERPAAWLSCDVADSDPLRFMAALIEALGRGLGDPALGRSASQLLALDGAVSVDAVAALADDLEEHAGPAVVVIDDFHLAAGSESALGDFLERRPPSLQVVVASRARPLLRLQRMRAGEQLVELGDGDLAFSTEEAGDLFSACRLTVAAPAIDAVRRHTEGWATGLQMMALSMRASPDPDTVLRRGAEAHVVAAYFLEEVLSRQPDHVVEFMMATSVLDELSVPACTAVAGEGAGAILDHLHRSNLFVTAVDEAERVYRYHHLIKDVLRDELYTRSPERKARLHGAAADFLLARGQAAEAARHLLAAGQSEHASRVLGEQLVRDVLTFPAMTSALDLDEFRPENFAGIPEMLVPLGAELLWRGAFDRGACAVALARRCPVDPARQPELAVRLALVETLHHTFIGEFDAALRHYEIARSLRTTARGVDDWMVTLDALAMYDHTYLGNFREARALAESLVAGTTSVGPNDLLCSGVISQVALLEGQLDEAAVLADRTLDAARRSGFDHHYFVFHAIRTTAQLALERRDLVSATDAVERALGIVDAGRPVFSFLGQLDRARIWAAGGHPETALASLPAVRAALRSQDSTLLADADELEARLRLQLGDQRGAAFVARRLPTGRRVVVEATIALAVGEVKQAERLLADVDARGTTVRREVELALLRAQAAVDRGDRRAGDEIRRTVEDACGHGFVQTVLDTTPRLVDHLRAHPGTHGPAAASARLFAARSEMERASGPRHAEPPRPLTDAELRVLTKVAERLPYAEVASELYVSLNTVKTHLRTAYAKLGVNSRSSAVARARVLGLL